MTTPAVTEPAADPVTPEPQAPPAGQEPARQPEPPAPAGGKEPAQQAQPPAGSVDELPPWAQRELRKLRDENAATRVKSKEVADALAAKEAADTERWDKVAKALGLKPDEVTPEQIAEQAQAERDTFKAQAEQATVQARQAAVELAVLRAAAAADADGNALLDSRSFLAAISGLDPAAADFGQQVKDAIAAAVEANPRYKADAGPPAPPPKPEPVMPSSGPGQFTGPPNAPRQWTQQDVDQATPAELDKAITDGLLVSLGVGKRKRYGWGVPASQRR